MVSGTNLSAGPNASPGLGHLSESSVGARNPWPAALVAVGALTLDDTTVVGVVDDIAIPVILAGALAYDLTQRTFITYTMTHNANPNLVYSGRASGFGIPEAIMDARMTSHHMIALGFGDPVIDVAAQGADAYPAIRGREQQLIDFHGGARSHGGTSANTIRGVGYYNFAGYYLWMQSNLRFGPYAPYTGSPLYAPKR